MTTAAGMSLRGVGAVDDATTGGGADDATRGGGGYDKGRERSVDGRRRESGE